MSVPASQPMAERKALATLAAYDAVVRLERPASPRRAAPRLQEWRTKEKVKTQHALVALCLNVGIDPPDVVRMKECAKLECWIDPQAAQAQTGWQQKPTEVIGERLLEQYKSLQKNVLAKAAVQTNNRYILEPSVDDLRRELAQTRKKAKDGRVLFHYNGHGCPKATPYGELWFFDRDHTQYVPVSLADIISCVNSPTVYVLECSNAGAILFYWYKQRYHETRKNDILICACKANESLPMNPNLPADLLTSCLTTPIRMALEWYFRYGQKERLLPHITLEMLTHLLGSTTDRRSPMGELHWIFTAVTDTIAWCMLPRPMFQRLFRQDFLLVSLFRNFLLAERVMRETGCEPVSHPQLPSRTWNHYMWDTWDVALESIMAQVPEMAANPTYQYRPTTFFSDQLTSFEIWIEFGTEKDPPPDQMPCVIQSLSSQQHRARALELLARYLDLGPWAVNDALACGVMPYVMKFLAHSELLYMLVVIWVKILCLDKTQTTLQDLFKTQSHKQFMHLLQPPQCRLDLPPSLRVSPPSTPPGGVSPLVSNTPGFDLVGPPPPEQERWPPRKDDFQAELMMKGTTSPQCCAMACYVLCLMMDGIGPTCQADCWNHQLMPHLVSLISTDDPNLRLWVCLTIGKLLDGFEQAKYFCCLEKVYEQLTRLLGDPSLHVRAACVYALSKFVGDVQSLAGSRSSRWKERPRAQSSMVSDGSTAAPPMRLPFSQSTMQFREMELSPRKTRPQPKSESADDLPALDRGDARPFFKQLLASSSESTPIAVAGALPPEGEHAQKFSVDFALWVHLVEAAHDPAPAVRRQLAFAIGTFFVYYRQHLSHEQVKALQERKAPLPRTQSSLSRYLYNPETCSSLSKAHFTDNPHVADLEPALPPFRCPVFDVAADGSPTLGSTSSINSPTYSRGVKSAPGSSGRNNPDESPGPLSPTLALSAVGGSTAPASRWLSSMQQHNLADIRERKLQLIGDLCLVLGTLLYDPCARVAETAQAIAQWLAAAHSAGLAAPARTDLAPPHAGEAAAHSSIHAHYYAQMETPIFDRAEGEDEEVAGTDEQYEAKFENLAKVFKTNATRTFSAASRLSLEPLCCGGGVGASPDAVTALQFQAFQPNVIFADAAGVIQVCTYQRTEGQPLTSNDVFGSQLQRIQEASTLNVFQHVNSTAPRDARQLVSSIHVINDQTSSPLLMVADCYGQVSVYADFTLANRQSTATAFRLPLPDALLVRPAVTDWHQRHGLLYYSAGDERVCLFDMHEQRLFQTVLAPDQQVTAIHSDGTGGQMLFVGLADGTVRIYDQRVGGMGGGAQHHILVSALTDANRLRSVSGGLPKVTQCVYKNGAVFSGSTNGLIKVWDLRRRAVHRQYDVGRRLDGFDVHPHLPIFACALAGDPPLLQLYSTKGELLSSRTRSAAGPGCALAFHPLQAYLSLDKDVFQL